MLLRLAKQGVLPVFPVDGPELELSPVSSLSDGVVVICSTVWQRQSAG